MLAHLGLVSVPKRIFTKLDRRLELTVEEEAVLERATSLSASLVKGLPRLEQVQHAIVWGRLRYDGAGSAPDSPVGDALPLASRLLRLCADLDRLTLRGLSDAEAFAVLRMDAGAYDPVLLAAAGGRGNTTRAVGFVSIAELRREMVIAADVTSSAGRLLIGRGTPVTAGLVERLRNHLENGTFSGSVLVETGAGPDRRLPHRDLSGHRR